MKWRKLIAALGGAAADDACEAAPARHLRSLYLGQSNNSC